MGNGNDSLGDFVFEQHSFDGETKTVFVTGHGPAVIVMTEMPGITPTVARFARWVRDAGFTVFLPSLFGRDGHEPTMALAGEALGSACVRREFEAFAAGRPSPMVQWLRSLAALAHDRCGGPGVGAVGMCFTGNFALALTLERAVIAAVMAQPSLPLDDPAGTFIHDAEMEAISTRLHHDDLVVHAYRFDGDPFCRAARFETFEEALGDRIATRVLEDGAAGDLGWLEVPHSVFTTSIIDESGQPTAAARDEVLGLLQRSLLERG